MQFNEMIGVAMDSSHRQELSTSHNYFINDDIKDSQNLNSLIRTLKFCGPNDVVNIYINTGGGDLYTTMQIVNSMRACAGRVATHADGQVASAGSLIFFAGDMLSVSDLSSFLIHVGSMFTSGKTSDVHSSADHSRALLHKIFHSVYEPFFSVEEIDKVLAGVDIHLGSEQVIGRIDKVCNIEKEVSNEDIPKPEPTPTKPKRVRKPKAAG
jgi:ATP-dependent protease ClpP protease subunit